MVPVGGTEGEKVGLSVIITLGLIPVGLSLGVSVGTPEVTYVVLSVGVVVASFDGAVVDTVVGFSVDTVVGTPVVERLGRVLGIGGEVFGTLGTGVY